MPFMTTLHCLVKINMFFFPFGHHSSQTHWISSSVHGLWFQNSYHMDAGGLLVAMIVEFPSLKSFICSQFFSEQTLPSLVRHTGLIITWVGSVLQAPASYNLSSHYTRKHVVPWVSIVFSRLGIWTCGYCQDKLYLSLCRFSWQILHHALGF